MVDAYTRPHLTDGNVTLRPPVMADVDARLAAGNHTEIQHMYGVPEGQAPADNRAMLVTGLLVPEWRAVA